MKNNSSFTEVLDQLLQKEEDIAEYILVNFVEFNLEIEGSSKQLNERVGSFGDLINDLIRLH